MPADGLRASAKHKDDFEATLTKDQVESFPPYDESNLDSDDKWSDYEGRFRSKWVSDPSCIARRLTGTSLRRLSRPQETSSLNVPPRALMASLVPRDLDRCLWLGIEAPLRRILQKASAVTERAVPAGTDSVVISNSAVGIGGRWDTFQSRLRERRKEVVAACNTCSGESAVKRGSESAGSLRKAV